MEIKEFVIQSSPYYKEEMKEHAAKLRFLLGTEDSLFHRDIVIEYSTIAKRFITDHVAENLACNPEIIAVELEELDIFKLTGA